MSKSLDIETIVHILEDATGDDVERAVAGGTTVLWSRRTDGSIVCVTELDGPFGHIEDDGSVEVDGFMVGLYENEEDYLEGAAPWTPIIETGPSYSDLFRALDALPAPAKRERRIEGHDRMVERYNSQTITVGQLRTLIEGLPDDMPVNTYDRDADDYRNIPSAETQDGWIVVLDVAEPTDNRGW